MAPLRNLKLLCAGNAVLGVAVLGGTAFAQEPTRPAVRLLPAKPMDPVDGLVARGAAFDPLAKADSSRNDAPRLRALLEASKDKEPEKPAEPGPLKKLGKWFDDKATAVKKKLDAPPAEQPPPRVAGAEKPPEKGPLMKLFETKPEAPKEPKKPTTAAPAYRWYGYGTVMPGGNQYAPTGDYPSASAQWYVQSGATPGAFPVPVMNPLRPAPGPAVPTYQPVMQQQPVMQPQPQLVPPEPRVVPVTQPVRRTIAETPPVQVPGLVPQVAPPTAPPMPATVTPSATIPGVPVSTAVPRMTIVPKPEAAKPEPAWQPASAVEPAKPVEKEEPLIVPVIRGAAPTLDESPLARTIKAACQGVATNVVIRETGPRQLSVSFSAATTTLAETAAKAVANLSELKGFHIDFKASVAK